MTFDLNWVQRIILAIVGTFGAWLLIELLTDAKGIVDYLKLAALALFMMAVVAAVLLSVVGLWRWAL